mgnify:CR=1 FL=1
MSLALYTNYMNRNSYDIDLSRVMHIVVYQLSNIMAAALHKLLLEL